MGYVDADHECIQCSKGPGHIDHTEVPASVAGYKQHNVPRIVRERVDRELPEGSIFQGRFPCGDALNKRKHQQQKRYYGSTAHGAHPFHSKVPSQYCVGIQRTDSSVSPGQSIKFRPPPSSSSKFVDCPGRISGGLPCHRRKQRRIYPCASCRCPELAVIGNAKLNNRNAHKPKAAWASDTRTAGPANHHRRVRSPHRATGHARPAAGPTAAGSAVGSLRGCR